MAWQKGTSGNPSGVTMEGQKRWTYAIRKVLCDEDPVRKRRRLDVLAMKLYDLAMEGEGWAFALIGDRMDGKPEQPVAVTIDDKRDASDWTRAELVAFLNNAEDGGAGTVAPDGRNGGSDSFH